MKAVRFTLIVITAAAILPDVTSWIVDMAEVEMLNEQPNEEPNYDDIWPGVASVYDNEVMYTANYAETFNHQTYKKKEVDNIIKNGGVYLEGLSDAMAAYRDTLEECNRNSSKTFAGDGTSGEERTRCEKAEKKKHYIQKLSEIALRTTDKMRVKVYEDTNEESSEEADLIRLAWTLDRLAALTGYDSSPHNDENLNDGLQDTLKMTTEVNENTVTEDNRQLEILEQVENGRPLPPKLTAVKSVQKRDTSDVMKYYLKYKVWNGSNTVNLSNDDDFDVQNSLRVVPIRKRSIVDKKAANMKSVILKMRQRRCKLKDRSETHLRKLVKSIKVYRRKIFKNNNSH